MRLLHYQNSPITKRGFTIIEMLVVAPIVILFIGAFIAAIVGMTGEVLTTRGANKLTYDIQDTLNRIEQDVNSSAAFLSTNNFTLSSPQGYNNGTTAFKNVGSNGNMLILNVYATTKNPLDADNQIVYTKNQPNTCASNDITLNPPVMLNIVYFVKDNTLYRRVLAPSFYDTVGCSVPWQTPSCAQGVTGTLCKSTDIRLIDGIANVNDFKIDYYPTQSSTIANATAVNSGATDQDRQTALQSTKSIKVTLNASTSIAGRTFSQSGTIRANSPNNNVASTSNVQAPVITSNPSNTTVGTGSTPTFSASASGTSLGVKWQASTDSGSNWVDIPGATSTTLSYGTATGTMDGYLVRAVFTNTAGSATTSSARLTVYDTSWNSLSMSSGWSTYDGTYSSPAYRKTSDGVVILKGMVKKSTAVSSGEVIGVLPASYRPTNVLIFVTSTNSNVYSRVDIYPDGAIVATKANNTWLSFENIHFIPDNGRYTQNTLMPLSNSWNSYTAVYGGDFAIPSYVTDDTGRIHTQGLVTAGTVADNTIIANLPAALSPQEYLHIPAANNNFSMIGISTTSGPPVTPSAIRAKGGTTSNGYLSIQAMFYPASVGTWTDLTYKNSWSRYSTNYSSGQYIKASDGLVALKGLLKGGSTSGGAVIATLPAGYRPAERLLIAVYSNAAYGRLDILPNGDLTFQTGSGSTFSLDGVVFYADQ